MRAFEVPHPAAPPDQDQGRTPCPVPDIWGKGGAASAAMIAAVTSSGGQEHRHLSSSSGGRGNMLLLLLPLLACCCCYMLPPLLLKILPLRHQRQGSAASASVGLALGGLTSRAVR